jgi:hypothetical protein
MITYDTPRVEQATRAPRLTSRAAARRRAHGFDET